jgi:hypothetical protein
MGLTAHPLPHSPDHEDLLAARSVAQYRRLADAIMARGDGERALPREHQEALDIDPTRSPAPLSDAGAGVEAIMHRLLRGGATDIAVTTHPLWIVGHGPSGRQWQILWDRPRQAYCVSRWTTDENGTEGLGRFPSWDAAVACALQA